MNKKLIFLVFLVLIAAAFFLFFVNGADTIESHNTGSNASDGMGNAIWLRAVDMNTVDFNKLKQAHINTIFLNYAAVDTYGKDEVASWVNNANSKGFNVHIWMQVLYHDDFENPLNSDGGLNQVLLNKDVNDSREYASIPGIKGIVLDYIRYPGTANEYEDSSEAVSVFVNTLVNNIHDVNDDLLVSGTFMPESSKLLSNYGQDLDNLSSVLDYVIPMMYKGNYGEGSYWVETTTNYFAANSNDAKVLVSLQAYKSDGDISLLSSSELMEDTAEAYVGGGDNVAFFRYGLTDFNELDTNVNFTSLDIIKIRLSSFFNFSNKE